MKSSLAMNFSWKHYVLILLINFIPLVSTGQELRCVVQVVAPGVQGTSRQVFESMQTSIMEFMNGQRWTDHQFESGERVECTILINIREVVGNDEFKGTMQVQSRRPVFNASYNTPLINFMDQDIHFRYIEFEQLTYNPANIESNLVAILAYYAYIILGYDYDSFSLRGGTPFFQRAQQVVNISQNAREAGWRAFEDTRNRYWLVENLLNEQHSQLRASYHQYHRRGLDMMAERPEEGRAAILTSLEQLQRVHRQNPNSFALSFFFDAKREELVNIFSGSPSMERARAVNLLVEIDPANADKYRGMLDQSGF